MLLYVLKVLILINTHLAVPLLDKMLQIDPEKRCSAEEALQAQYLAPYHDPEDEPTAAEKFNWNYCEADLPADVWKTLIYSEILSYHDSSSGNLNAMTSSFDEMETS